MLSPNSLAVGHVLSSDVCDKNGLMMAPAGCVVNQDLLLRVRQQGLPVQVLSANADVGTALDHLFRHWRFSPGMRQLRDLMMDFRMSINC